MSANHPSANNFFTQRWLPGPVWLQFLLLGTVLHIAMAWMYPAPIPTLGPPDPNRLQVRYRQYADLAGQQPNADAIARIVDGELRDELLFTRALEMGLYRRDPAVRDRLLRNMRFLDPTDARPPDTLVEAGLTLNMHLTDPVVRGRLIQVMTQRLEARLEPMVVGEAELREAYMKQSPPLTQPAMISFRQIFLGSIDRGRAMQLAKSLETGERSVQEVMKHARPLLAGSVFTSVDWPEIESRLGEAFADGLARGIDGMVGPGWLTPVRSVYGVHLVYLESHEPGRALDFEEARAPLREILEKAQRRRALERAIDA